MFSKFKVKKKLVSIALALVLAAQPLATLPMNVFAGTDKNNLMMAPRIEKKTVSVTSAFVGTVTGNGTGSWSYWYHNGDYGDTSTDFISLNFTGVCIVPAPVPVNAPVLVTFYGTFTGLINGHGTFTSPVTFTSSVTAPVTAPVTFTLNGSSINVNLLTGDVHTARGSLNGTGTVFVDNTVPVDVTARVTDSNIDIEATAASQPPAEPTA